MVRNGGPGVTGIHGGSPSVSPVYSHAVPGRDAAAVPAAFRPFFSAPVLFVVSDLHLGKSPDTDAERLRALEACIASEETSVVVFLGDVFDAFIESRARVPAIVDAWGQLAGRLLAQGCTIHYVMGNHDRWHRSYVSGIIGQAPIRHVLHLDREGVRLHLEHGDRGHQHNAVTRFGRWLSDLRWIHRLYTRMLPFGGAQKLAAAVSRRFASFEPDTHIIGGLQTYARQTLRTGTASGIILGHCHQMGLQDLSAQTGRASWYANSGDWYADRSYVLIGQGQVRVCAWREGRRETMASLPLDADPGKV